jgi:hypothetical protein
VDDAEVPKKGWHKVQWEQWMVQLTMLDDGSVDCSLRNCSSSKEPGDLLNRTYGSCDVLFQELLTLLDDSIWSSLATHQVAHGQPTLGGYDC